MSCDLLIEVNEDRSDWKRGFTWLSVSFNVFMAPAYVWINLSVSIIRSSSMVCIWSHAFEHSASLSLFLVLQWQRRSTYSTHFHVTKLTSDLHFFRGIMILLLCLVQLLFELLQSGFDLNISEAQIKWVKKQSRRVRMSSARASYIPSRDYLDARRRRLGKEQRRRRRRGTAQSKSSI